MKTVLFVLLDLYADWEAAPLAAVINPTPGWRVKTAAPGGAAVRSIGGFATVPDYSLEQALAEKFAGIVLVGGMSWRIDAAKAVAPLARRAVENGIPLGAICDATVFAGTLGLLNGIPHTSNMLDDLKSYAGADYTGEKYYRNEPAVRSGGLVTANGSAAMEFSREMLVALDLMDEEDAGRWYRLFTKGFYEAQQEAFWWFDRLNAKRD
ncbi:MAG: DJ-1/PfpI family protein [Victivallaceae bacterium]|nr:DJ-1/PfpI family protein [Victivallaceae bacterium]